MSTAIERAGIPSLGLEQDFSSRNTLFPSILATVLLCGILTTLFTAARLITKRFVSSYDVEDCESKRTHVTIPVTSNAMSPSRFLDNGMGTFFQLEHLTFSDMRID